eukprot:jgi/Chlat1/5874/Chrsp4S06382
MVTSCSNRFLAAALGLHEHRTHSRSAICIDYFTSVLTIADDCALSPRATQQLLAHSAQLLTIAARGGDFAEAQKLFVSRMLQHCNAPATNKSSDDTNNPTTTARIPASDVKRLSDHFAQTFFQHYRLYAAVLMHEQEHDAKSVEVIVETATSQPLRLARTAEEREMEARKRAEEARLEEEREQARREQERIEQERKEQEELELRRRKPQTLDEAVAAAVQLKVEAVRTTLAEEYREKERELREKIAKLEGQLVT